MSTILPPLPPLITSEQRLAMLESMKAENAAKMVAPSIVPEQLPPLRSFTLASFAGKPIPQREFLVSDLIPARVVAGLYGDGAGGKSLLAIMLGISIIMNRPFAGHLVQRTGPVVYLCCEDEEEEVHRRAADICTAMAVDLADLANFHVVPLVDEDAILAMQQGASSVLTITPRYQQVTELCANVRPALVILDTLNDVFAGSENDRMLAKQFVRIVQKLIRPCGGTGLIIAHPSVEGMKSGRGTSGSTGWNNSVRCRLYLERVVDEYGNEPDRDRRTLSLKKMNYGPAGGEIQLRYRDGYFALDSSQAAGDPLQATATADNRFLELLTAYVTDGRIVSSTRSANYAPTLFSRDERAKGMRAKMFEAAMNRLFAAGRIQTKEIGPPSKRRRSLVPTK
jgi:RecA-family ATPase